MHYLRTKDGAEIDFALSVGTKLTHMIECKLSDAAPARAFTNFGSQWPDAKAIQVVRHLPKAEHYKGVDIVNATQFFAAFEV